MSLDMSLDARRLEDFFRETLARVPTGAMSQSIRPDRGCTAAMTAVAHDAEWLRRWPQVAIRVDGHADERDTAEFNLALGWRRADAVEHYLADLCMDRRQMTGTSLGKEAPFCTGSTESRWSQNRRGHFVVTAK